jgi:hypothetical protein
MTWRAELRGIRKRVRRCTSRLEQAYLERSWDQPLQSSSYVGALVVELDNLCVDALRSFAIATLRREQASGLSIRRIGRRPIGPEEYGALVLEATQPVKYRRIRPLAISRREERTIRNPVEIRTVLHVAGAPPQVDLNNAIALNYAVFTEIKFPRNYYAHRGYSTLSELINAFGVPRLGPTRDPDQVIHHRPAGVGTPQFVEWLAEVRTFFEVAIP